MGKTFTMPQFVEIAVSADCVNSTRSDITGGNHTIIIDEPPMRHGNDEGMLPLQALMGALASCSHVVVNLAAREIGFEFVDSAIDVAGKFDTRGFTGDAKVSPPFPEVDITIKAETNGTPEQLADLKAQLKWRCPVYGTFAAAGTKINETWLLNESGSEDG